MKIKKILSLALMTLLLCLPMWALAAQSISINDGEKVTLTGTLSQGYDIRVTGDATLVLDHVNITALENDYAVLHLKGDGNLNVIFKGNNVLTHSNVYGIFSDEVCVTLTPDGNDASLRVNAAEAGINADYVNIGAGARIDVLSDGNAFDCQELNIGSDAVLNVDGGWHGLNVTKHAAIGKNATVNARGNFNGVCLSVDFMMLEEGARLNAYSDAFVDRDGTIRREGMPFDAWNSKVIIKNGAELNATSDASEYAAELAEASLIVEAGGKLNIINNYSAGLGLFMEDGCAMQFNSTDVTISGDRAAIEGEGTIRCGEGVAAVHREKETDKWERMLGNTTDRRYFRTMDEALAPKLEMNLPNTGDESSIIFWAVLACMSLLGVAMLARRRKAA